MKLKIYNKFYILKENSCGGPDWPVKFWSEGIEWFWRILRWWCFFLYHSKPILSFLSLSLWKWLLMNHSPWKDHVLPILIHTTLCVWYIIWSLSWEMTYSELGLRHYLSMGYSPVPLLHILSHVNCFRIWTHVNLLIYYCFCVWFLPEFSFSFLIKFLPEFYSDQ